MTRYAAFLRGINLGRRRVTGEQLREPFLQLGFDDVDTFLASGNVVFSAEDADAGPLTARIEAHLEEALGYPVLTFLRTQGQLADIVASEPFTPAELARTAGKHQVVFLRSRPTEEAAADALALATDDDRLVLHDTELHWLPAGGMSASALDVNALDRLIGPTTTRTVNTVRRLHTKYFAA